jgi:molybdopterin-guanine dinucleotide biosynthesis protein A
VYALLRRSCQESLYAYIESGQCKVEDWMQQVEAAPVDFSDDRAEFANINLPGDL